MRDLISQLCRQRDFDSPEYRRWCELLHEAPRYHRKQWEYCYIMQALGERDMFRPGRRGIGFGVGREPLAAAMASLGCEIVATDQRAETAGAWAKTEQHAGDLADLNDRGICEKVKFSSLVRFEPCDMNAIGEHLRDFDFSWSSCSFEHLGSIDLGLRFLLEQMKCLKRDGVAVHTTEFNISSNDDTLDTGGTVLFRRRDVERGLAYLRTFGHRAMVSFDVGDLPLDHHVDVPPYSEDEHLKLRIAGFVSTSIGIIVEK